METALRLYQDPELLAFILQNASIPEASERIALSLSDADQGPFVLVTREGRFVTCLGEGMGLEDAHLLRHAQIGALAARHEHWRERWRVANERTQHGKHLARLIERLTRGGLNIAREDMVALAGWVPGIGLSLQRIFVEYLEKRPQCFEMVQAHCRRGIDAPAEKFLRVLWGFDHSIGHIMALLASEGAYQIPETINPAVILNASWQSGSLLPAMQVAWALGRLGKPFLRPLKDGYREAIVEEEFLTAFFGLVQLGLQHRSLREEVHKFLLSAQPETNWGPSLRKRHDALRSLLEKIFDNADLFEKVHLIMGRVFAVKAGEFGYPEMAGRFPDVESVPEGIARAAALRLFQDRRKSNPDFLLMALQVQPWLARASLEDLYLPEEIVSIWRETPAPGDLRTFALNHDPLPPEEPYRKPDTPGRNDPCPCGSGKKWKRCCGA